MLTSRISKARDPFTKVAPSCPIQRSHLNLVLGENSQSFLSSVE